MYFYISCSFLFELFGKAELNFTTKAYLGDTLDKMVTFLTNESKNTLTLICVLKVLKIISVSFYL